MRHVRQSRWGEEDRKGHARRFAPAWEHRSEQLCVAWQAVYRIEPGVWMKPDLLSAMIPAGSLTEPCRPRPSRAR
jgi:hypothetical protein